MKNLKKPKNYPPVYSGTQKEKNENTYSLFSNSAGNYFNLIFIFCFCPGYDGRPKRISADDGYDAGYVEANGIYVSANVKGRYEHGDDEKDGGSDEADERHDGNDVRHDGFRYDEYDDERGYAEKYESNAPANGFDDEVNYIQQSQK